MCEILRMTGRARDMILDPDQTDRLREVIAEGEYYGMQTFDQALLSHYQAGRVSMEDALRVASSPHDFKLLVAGEGRTATSMDDLAGSDHVSARPAAPPSPAARPCSRCHGRRADRSGERAAVRAAAGHGRVAGAPPRLPRDPPAHAAALRGSHNSVIILTPEACDLGIGFRRRNKLQRRRGEKERDGWC